MTAELDATPAPANATEPGAVTAVPRAERPWGIAIVLVLTGAVGWLGALALLTERIAKLIDPSHSISCDINPLLSCGAIMETWQASLLGFPNPILGVAGFVAPMAVGVALLAGARFDRWFWGLFLAGVTGAWLFISWLFQQAVFEIGVLCPYCMVVWAAVIPMFWSLLLWLLASGVVANGGTQRAARAVLPFTWVIVLANYAGIAFAIMIVFPGLLAGLY